MVRFKSYKDAQGQEHKPGLLEKGLAHLTFQQRSRPFSSGLSFCVRLLTNNPGVDHTVQVLHGTAASMHAGLRTLPGDPGSLAVSASPCPVLRLEKLSASRLMFLNKPFGPQEELDPEARQGLCCSSA